MAKTPLTAAGHDDLRTYIMANWLWFEVRNELGVAVLRIQIDDDARVVWSEDGEVLKVNCVLSGDDEEMGDVEETPITVQYSAFFKADEGGDSMHTAEFTPFTFGHADDELVIKHYVEVPEQV